MEKGFIPPNILLENFKPELKPLFDGPLKIARKLEPWPPMSVTGRRKAVANSFGSGGTNAMVLLESANTFEAPGGATNGVNGHTNGTNGVNGVDGVNGYKKKRSHLITFSARSEHSLAGQIRDIKEYIQDKKPAVDFEDLSYTLTCKRSHFPWRSSIVAADTQSLLEALADSSKPMTATKKTPSSTAFVFTGQGAQYSQMGSDLLRSTFPESAFSRSICHSDKLLKSLGADWSLVDELLADESSSRLNDSRFGQPSSTAVQLALVDLLKSWGVQPCAVIGHSSGEIAAAYTAGAITHESAIRAAYVRSFLSAAARERNAEPGAMLATGVGKDDAEALIAKLSAEHEDDNSQAVVACINSPSSTTLSGDATAIYRLEDALKADGKFARRLKVDTAYHSHHMKSVGGDYLERLSHFASGPTDQGVRFFSTVLGKEKRSDFDASYWVENLVSPVRFSEALDSLVREVVGGSQGSTSLNIIEIGPHGALGGPIRQCLTSSSNSGVPFKYAPTLVRGQDSHQSLLETASSLYQVGLDLDLASVVSLGRPASVGPKTLHNLPPYHWDHSKSYWNEPRLSSDYRKRPHANHDLLGLRIQTTTDADPTWRIILSHDTLPWLKDHVVDKFVVFPGSGYVAMAIEGFKQLKPGLPATGYRLRNISFKRTLLIPEDSSVEAVVSFHRSTRAGYTFRVSSIAGGKWQEHCDGHISSVAKAANEVDEVERGRVAAFSEAIQAQKLKAFKARGSKNLSIPHRAFYEELAACGNEYGPSFAAVDETYIDAEGSQALSVISVPNIAATMPAEFQSPHTIHPATLDAALHAVVAVFQMQSASEGGSMMPVFMSDLFVSADITSTPGQKLEVLCDLHTTYPTSSNLDITVFQAGEDGSQKPVLTLNNGELRVVGSSNDGDELSEQAGGSGGHVFKVEWGLDIASVTPAEIEAVEVPAQCQVEAKEKIAIMNGAATRYFSWAAQEIANARGSLNVADGYWKLLWSYVEDLLGSEEGQAALEAVPDSEAELSTLLASIGVEGELLHRLGPRLASIVTGQTEPLPLFLEDNLLYRVYDGDEIGRCNYQMAEYVRMLTFQNSGLRILELGAGTAGATVPLLQACSPGGENAFCAEYMYTDISSGFFDVVKQTKLKKWEHMLKFKTLDLEQDPVSQGFEEQAYDLVIASNVVHATKFLGTTLGNIHRLLKPGGKLGIVEAVRITPYSNMTFGLLPGWWAGADDGRTRGPLLSISQWNDRFKGAEFSGVDFASFDHPEPARHASFFLSTARPLDQPNGDGVNGHAAPTIKLLNALPDGHTVGQEFELKLRKELGGGGLESAAQEWSVEGIEEAGSYVVLDSAAQPFLLRATAEQFHFITTLLSKETTLYWITLPDSQRTTPAAERPELGLVMGFSRVARSEYYNLKFYTINVQDELGDEEETSRVLNAVRKLIVSAETRKPSPDDLTVEYEYTLRQGKLHIQRVSPDAKLSKSILAADRDPAQDTEALEQCLFHQPDRPLKVKVHKPGLLSSLQYVDDELPTTAELEPSQVEVQMFAHGVNFKDQFIALGQMKATQVMVGEGAGVVVRVGSDWTNTYQPGQRVAVAMGTPYASRTVTSGHFIQPIPDTMSFTDAASIPVAFGTAYYGLVDCARLAKGQSILIHAASGGLGQAAIMIARHIGVSRIFATVGSHAKKLLLMDRYGIPEDHIFNSRTTSFRDGIMQLTRGEGVDVVLNSLAGDALAATWDCVAPLGAFVEVGKTDIYQRNQLDMEPFDRNVSFIAVDLTVLARRRPAQLQSVLERVFEHVREGQLEPLPVTPMPIGNIEQAFRSIQARKHTGKIVLESGPDATVTACRQPLKLRPDATYVLFGGLGSLGKHMCRLLQARGARHVVLATRRAMGDEEKAAAIAELVVQGSEASIQILTCDITVASGVSRTLADLQSSGPPVAGVFNLAMVIADHSLPQMSTEEFQKGVMPKHLGTRNIAKGLERAGIDPDFVIFFSSISAIVGLRGQGNYAAGNAFQDMFAQVEAGRAASRGTSLKYISLNLPAVEDSSVLMSDATKVKDPVVRQGCEVVPWRNVARLVEYAMSGHAARDNNPQLVLGLSAQSVMVRAANNTRISPLISRVYAAGLLQEQQQRQQQLAAGGSGACKRRSVEEAITAAASVEDAQALALEAIRDKVASLLAVLPEELSLDVSVTRLGLDSLVAIELKNWVTRSLKAKVQNSDIMDSPSLKAFTALVISRTSLLAKPDTDPTKKQDAEAAGVDGSLF